MDNIEIKFLADKVLFHHWPPGTPEWDEANKKFVDQQINKKKERKEIIIQDTSLKVDNFKFINIKKIGITIPLYKKQSTLVFEGHCNGFDAHVHITTKSHNYLEIFNELMIWREKYF